MLLVQRCVFTVLLVGMSLLGLLWSGSPASAAITQPQGKIAYQCTPDGPGQDEDFEICLIAPDGTGFQRLTNDNRRDSYPEISPDGRQVAWTHDLTEIWVMDIDGANRRQVTTINAEFTSPTWSPDGQKLAFTCNNPSNLDQYGLCTINLNGTGFQMVKVIESPAAPQWSPDGTSLLFEERLTNDEKDVMILNLQTKDLVNVTNTPNSSELGAWSPDGSKIAFIGGPIPADNDTLNNLYVIKPDGSGRTMLFDPGFGATTTNPAWSPDGAQIAFFCDMPPIAGDNEMCIVSAENGSLVRVVKTAGFELQQAFRPFWGLVRTTIQGDVDCDGDVDAIDSLKVLRRVANLSVFQEEGCPAIGSETPIFGDVDCSLALDAIDALKILRAVAVLSAVQSEPCVDIGELLTSETAQKPSLG